MTSGLGSSEGLKRIEREMGDLCERLGSASAGLARGEIERIGRSLAALSAAICAIDHAVRDRIRQLGGEQMNAG